MTNPVINPPTDDQPSYLTPVRKHNLVWSKVVIILLIIVNCLLLAYIMYNKLNLNSHEEHVTDYRMTIAPTTPSQATTTQTTSPTRDKPIGSLITYKIPSGWKRVYNDPYTSPEDFDKSKRLLFESDTYSVSEAGYIKTGAMISVIKSPVDPKKSLRIAMQEQTVGPYQDKIKDVTIAGLPGLTAFMCMDSCYQQYYLEANDYLWQIIYQCAPQCETEADVELHTNTKQRDAFLQSLQFN